VAEELNNLRLPRQRQGDIEQYDLCINDNKPFKYKASRQKYNKL
jgi:hypothetical protein